jgi:hypothetical protein
MLAGRVTGSWTPQRLPDTDEWVEWWGAFGYPRVPGLGSVRLSGLAGTAIPVAVLLTTVVAGEMLPLPPVVRLLLLWALLAALIPFLLWRRRSGVWVSRRGVRVVTAWGRTHECRWSELSVRVVRPVNEPQLELTGPGWRARLMLSLLSHESTSRMWTSRTRAELEWGAGQLRAMQAEAMVATDRPVGESTGQPTDGTPVRDSTDG